ncbi:T9SS type B sorting domain-containing protein [Bizionia sediminis]|uniref:T9SS type B sorting domain-containing protein n=1 Tax=Bizionia sediminis TaxID=1737064 RepID=A0ABW5KR27_9FLAO
MKNPICFKLILSALFALISLNSISQNYDPFTPRFDADIKGDILLIGNNIINRDTNSTTPNDPYFGTSNYNSDYNMQYIDIDNDPTTFSSSSANLEVPGSCYNVLYAGLYWGAIYQETDRSAINQIKLKLPQGGYNDITGEIIYDAVSTPIGSNGSTPYACYADVTGLVQSLADPNGTYTVGNMTSSLGYHGGTGLCGGWSLFVVYEDPALPGKAIVSFDGFSAIGGATTLDVPVSGFRTIPVGPVRAKFAFSALEGDFRIQGDYLRINGTTMNTPERPNRNFFNSKITNLAGEFNNRVPNSRNTLGFDAGILDVPNPGNSVIANGDTAATIRLGSTQDVYFYFFNAFAVDIIQPDINLTKNVENTAGVNINNGNVILGQELDYVLGFQNIGNDGATGYTITDVLPTNVDFLSVDLTNAPGVTFTYDAATHALLFNIPDNLVEEGDPNYEIRIRVKVIEECNQLRDACSNIIQNQAYQTYSSVTAGNVVANEDPSVSNIDICGFPTPGSTNFLVNIDGCTFEREEVLCGSSITLTAGNGYASYQWYQGTETTGTPIGTTQTITVTQPGIYTSVNTAPQPCVSTVETVNVVLFGANMPNPITPYANQVVICPNNGEELPEIFLCGAGDSVLLETNITDATSITWEVLNEASCGTAPANCPNTSPTCTWNEVGTGATFNVDTAGQYQLTVMYQNGCFRKFYFNVYQNLFTPTEVHRDITCTTNGQITVNGVPAGYEFSINGVGGPYQASNVFPIAVAGTYTIHIRPIGVTNPCIFTLADIPIRNRDFSADVLTNQPLCAGDQGSISIQMNDVNPQYYFELIQGGSVISSVGPIAASDYTFNNLNAGTYTVNATTDDGCVYTETTTLIAPDPLTVIATLTDPLTCTPGMLTMVANGGTPPYYYYINSTTDFQTVPEYEVTAAGTYTITVVDFNNCTATTQIQVSEMAAPQFTVSNTNILCYGDDTAEIIFNVLNANGYTLAYSIDNGTTFSPNPVFSNLVAGTYETIIQYSINGNNCVTSPQTITITEPDNALTASGGVAESAGCGPSGEGRVRITNPQGGTPPYAYSFDNGLTYGPSNEAYLFPGTYTLYIQDANGCIFPMVVTINPEPTPPTIEITNTNFNCDGSGNATVTVNNNGGNFNYTYLLDGVENTNVPSNVFVNVPSGNHTVTVQYENITIPTYSNLLFEDFGEGRNTTTPGIAPAYCFHDQTIFPSLCPPFNNPRLEDNQYAVTSAIIPNNPNWHPYRDHTSNGTNPNGRFLAVNIGSAAGPNGILYSKPINNVLPNQDIIVDLYLANLLDVGVAGADPDFILELVDGSGTVIASQATGIIDNTVNAWQLRSVSLNPGSNTTLTFQIRSGSILYNGNDAAIDDINVYQVPIVCTTEVNFPIVIDSNQAFSAQVVSATDVSCFGSNDGQITLAAANFQLPYGFDYSIDGGTTWTNSTSSPVTISNLPSGTYNVNIRYDDTASTCSFSFIQTISEPNALLATATLSSPATCLSGATITASASNGTPNYQYQLEDDLGNVIIAFQTNNTFSNVLPGNYVVVVQDANGCQDPIDSVISIASPSIPVATIAATSDICFDAGTLASLEVLVTGGVAPYSYSINGGVFQAANTFTNLTPGTYAIVVRDAYGCESVAVTQTISNQLTANAVLTKGLDCSANPDAEIATSISGGLAPYNYQVSFNGGAFSGTTGVIGTNFNYATATNGTYQFLITDAQGCTVQTAVVSIDSLPVLNAPSVSVVQNNLCFGDNSGAISVTPSGGLTPYTISVLNTTTGTNYGNQTTGLEAGDYTITVTDANSCSTSATAVITQPNAISYTVSTTDITCNNPGGTSYGEILVTNVSGGTAEYTYYVSNNFGYSDSYTTTAGGEDHAFIILDFGIYTVEVIDANGCSEIQNNITIASPPSDLDIDITTLTANCATGGTAVITVTSVVSSGSYEFGILETNTIPYTTTYQPADAGTPETSTFTGLTPGVTYTFVVHDLVTDCYYFETATGPISTPSNLTTTLTTVNNVSCTGNADGNVSFTVANYDSAATAVTYEIFNYQSNVSTGISGTITPLSGGTETVNNAGPLAPGQYYILLSEVGGAYNNCSAASINFNITESTNALNIAANIVSADNCSVNAGVISATAQFGTPPYEYQLNVAGAPAPNASTWTGSSNNVFNVEGGAYDIYVIDAYGCIQATSIVMPTDTAPNISLAINATTICNSEGNFEIVITRDNTVGVAPFTYSVNGSAFTSYTEDAFNSFTISGLNSGTHTVTIQDANGCTETETVTILPPLSGLASTSLSASPDCGASDGIITLSPSGGSGSYSFNLFPVTPGVILTGNTYTNVPSGSYTVTITDTNTLCSVSIPVSIATPDLPNINPVVSNVTCNAGTDGIITVNLTGTNTDPVYTYEINGPVTVGPQTGNVFNGLPAGSYTITVTSGRGCTTTSVVTISEPNSMNVPSAIVSEFACTANTNTVVNASITITGVTGGSGSYINYEFIQSGTVLQSGTANVYNEANVLGGSYVINVYDSNGCVGTTTATINPYTELLMPTINIDSPINCNTAETITITPNFNGVTPSVLNYTVIGLNGNPYNVSQSTGTFTGLTIGSYSITVENPATGCLVETVHYVSDPNSFTVEANVVSNVTCFGANNGAVDITFIDENTVPTNDAGPFSYTILDALGNTVLTGSSPNAGPLSISGLEGGVYSLEATLTNNPFCPAQINFTITQPAAALALQINSTPVTCITSGDDGTISASASFGWGAPYSYQLSLGATVISAWSPTNTFTNLTPGTYTVSVRDINGCEISTSETLVAPAAISGNLTAVPTALPCFNDANATLTVSGVTGGYGSDYVYTLINTVSGISSGPQASPVFTNIPAGSYFVTISDPWNCSNPTNTVTITQPSNVATGVVSIVNMPTCSSDAEIQITVSGGTAPYTFSTDGITFNPLNPSSTYVVGPGTYQYYIQDANGCNTTITNEITIDPVIPVTVNLDLSGSTINCSGGANGTIVATATNGLGNYSYELVDTNTNTVIQGPQANGIFQNISAGNYMVNVSSGVDCTGASAPISIANPNPLVVSTSKTDISCFGLTDGSITLNATGGTGTIQYAISPNLNQFVNTNVFTNLAAGTYDVIAQDENGCYDVFQIEIIEPDPLQAVFGTIADELCVNEGNGAITINITGGSGSYLVSLDNTNFTTVTGNTYTFTGLSGNTFYQIYVTDSNSCYINPPLEYFMPPAVEVIPSTSIALTCNANVPGNTVTINVNPEVLGAVTYSLDAINFSANNVFSNLTAGSYTAYVQHTNGCTQSVNFTIDALDPITATAATTANILCAGDSSGSIEVSAMGGTGTLEYAISPNFVFQTANVFNNLPAGTYSILVRDTISCEVSLTNLVVTEPSSALSATISGTPETCLNANDGSISVSLAGGTAPYFTSLDGVNFTQDVFDFNNLSGGNYTVYVQDANGCSLAPLSYTVAGGVAIQGSVTVANTCNNNITSNEITVTVNPTVSNSVQYSLDGTTFSNSNIFTNLAAGTYTAYIQHSNGCTELVPFTVTSLPVVTLNTVPTNLLCHGANNGSITVTATGGTNVFTYAISPNFVQTTENTFNNLAAGSYTVRVYDETGCYSEDTVVINEPAPLQANLVTVYEELCVDDNNGAIEISIPNGAGTPPYYTSLNNPNNFVQDQFIFDNLDGGQTYTIYVQDANNCQFTLDVTLQAPASLNAQANVAYLCEDNRVTITVDPSSANNVTYILNGNISQTSNVFTNVPAGLHEVEILHNQTGCFETVSFFIETVMPLGLTLEETDINQITATASGGSGSYTYYFNGIDNGSSNVFTFYQSGTVFVRVVDANGCEVERILPVVFVDVTIPNVFTPDGNGENDTWTPMNTENYPNIQTLVYDRHGRVVANLRQGQSWNGEYQGNPLPTGDYWYVISLGSARDNREFVGHFTLYR